MIPLGHLIAKILLNKFLSPYLKEELQPENIVQATLHTHAEIKLANLEFSNNIANAILKEQNIQLIATKLVIKELWCKVPIKDPLNNNIDVTVSGIYIVVKHGDPSTEIQVEQEVEGEDLTTSIYRNQPQLDRDALLQTLRDGASNADWDSTIDILVDRVEQMLLKEIKINDVNIILQKDINSLEIKVDSIKYEDVSTGGTIRKKVISFQGLTISLIRFAHNSIERFTIFSQKESSFSKDSNSDSITVFVHSQEGTLSPKKVEVYCKFNYFKFMMSPTCLRIILDMLNTSLSPSHHNDDADLMQSRIEAETTAKLKKTKDVIKITKQESEAELDAEMFTLNMKQLYENSIYADVDGKEGDTDESDDDAFEDCLDISEVDSNLHTIPDPVPTTYLLKLNLDSFKLCLVKDDTTILGNKQLDGKQQLLLSLNDICFEYCSNIPINISTGAIAIDELVSMDNRIFSQQIFTSESTNSAHAVISLSKNKANLIVGSNININIDTKFFDRFSSYVNVLKAALVSINENNNSPQTDEQLVNGQQGFDEQVAPQQEQRADLDENANNNVNEHANENENKTENANENGNKDDNDNANENEENTITEFVDYNGADSNSDAFSWDALIDKVCVTISPSLEATKSNDCETLLLSIHNISFCSSSERFEGSTHWGDINFSKLQVGVQSPKLQPTSDNTYSAPWIFEIDSAVAIGVDTTLSPSRNMFMNNNTAVNDNASCYEEIISPIKQQKSDSIILPFSTTPVKYEAQDKNLRPASNAQLEQFKTCALASSLLFIRTQIAHINISFVRWQIESLLSFVAALPSNLDQPSEKSEQEEDTLMLSTSEAIKDVTTLSFEIIIDKVSISLSDKVNNKFGLFQFSSRQLDIFHASNYLSRGQSYLVARADQLSFAAGSKEVFRATSTDSASCTIILEQSDSTDEILALVSLNQIIAAHKLGDTWLQQLLAFVSFSNGEIPDSEILEQPIDTTTKTSSPLDNIKLSLTLNNIFIQYEPFRSANSSILAIQTIEANNSKALAVNGRDISQFSSSIITSNSLNLLLVLRYCSFWIAKDCSQSIFFMDDVEVPELFKKGYRKILTLDVVDGELNLRSQSNGTKLPDIEFRIWGNLVKAAIKADSLACIQSLAMDWLACSSSCSSETITKVDSAAIHFTNEKEKVDESKQQLISDNGKEEEEEEEEQQQQQQQQQHISNQKQEEEEQNDDNDNNDTDGNDDDQEIENTNKQEEDDNDDDDEIIINAPQATENILLQNENDDNDGEVFMLDNDSETKSAKSNSTSSTSSSSTSSSNITWHTSATTLTFINDYFAPISNQTVIVNKLPESFPRSAVRFTVENMNVAISLESGSDFASSNVNSKLEGAVTLRMDNINFSFDQFVESKTNNWRLYLGIMDLTVLDTLKKSTKNKTLCYDVQVCRAENSQMISLTLDSIIDNKKDAFIFEMSMLPIRLYFDGHVKTFFETFFAPTFATPENGDGNNSSNNNSNKQDDDSTPLIFKQFIIHPIDLRADFSGHMWDVWQCVGNTTKVLELPPLQIENWMHSLTKIDYEDIDIAEVPIKVHADYNNQIQPDLIFRYLMHVKVLKPFAEVASGFSDLFMAPLHQYRSGGDIFTGIKQGTNSCAYKITEQLLNIPYDISSLMQKVLDAAYSLNGNRFLEDTDAIMQPTNSAITTNNTQKLNLFSDQPANVWEGLYGAGGAIGREMSNIWTIFGQISSATEAASAVPIIFIRPILGATKAAASVSGGIQNQINPQRKLEKENKYKHE